VVDVSGQVCALLTLSRVPARAGYPLHRLGCIQTTRSLTGNTRARFDWCSAHRAGPSGPIAPGRVFGPPLRQLASDPSVPVEGGSANDYDYCFGDPVNCNDLGGTKPKARELTPAERATLGRLLSDCSGPDQYGADISGSSSCQRFRTAFASGNLSEFGIGFTPRGAGECPSWIVSASRFVGAGDFARAGNDLRQFHYRDALTDAKGGSESNVLLKHLEKQAVRAGSKVAGAVSIGGTLAGTAVDAVCTLH
jgi:hypothetical protein